MPVYDDEKQKITPNHDGSHDDLSVHPERREAEIDSLDKLYKAESATEPGSTKSKSEEKEQKRLSNKNHDNDDSSGWDTDLSPNKKRRIRNLRKRYIAGGGIAGLLVGTGIGFFGFLAGPMQFLQFAKLLEQFHFGNNQSFTDGRVGRLIRWARTNPEDRNLGRTGNRIAEHYEAKLARNGVEFRYNSAGRLSSIEVDPNSRAGKALLDGIDAENGIALPRPNDGSKITLELAENSSEITNTGARRKLIKASVEAVGMNKISSSMSARMLKVRAGVDFNPLQNLARNADERLRLSYDEWRDRVKEERNKNIKTGADPPSVTSARSDDPNNPASEADREGASRAQQEIDDLIGDSRVNDPTELKASRIRGKLTAGLGVAGVIATVCGLDSIGDASAQLQETNVVMPLIRTGMTFMSTGSQIMAGEGVNFDELGALSQDFYDKKTGTSWMSAKSIQNELGRPNTGKEMPESARPGKDRPFFFKKLDEWTRPLPCSAINSTFGGLALTVIGAGLTFTGPLSVLLNLGSEAAQTFIAGAFVDDLVRWLAGDAVDITNAVGADLGNYANYGAFLANNNQMLGMGGRELSTQESAALDREYRKQLKEEQKNKPLIDRIASPYNPNSLFAKTVLQNKSFAHTSTAASSLVQMPIKSLTSFGSVFKSLSPAVFAQEASYDYGVPEYGFSLDEINKPELEDPYENAEVVEPKLAELNSKYGEPCFGTTVDPSTGAIKFSQAPAYSDLEGRKGDCGPDNSDPDFLRYRMYIADSIAAASITCYEGIDSTGCQQLGISGGDSQQPTTPTGPVNLPSGDAIALAQNILNNAKIGKRGDAQNQLTSIAGGSGPCPSVNNGQYTVDTELLRVIAALGQNNEFTISSLHRGCTNSRVGAGTNSRHWRGKAVDISGAAGVNGVSMPSFEAYDTSGVLTRFIQEAARILPANCEIGVPNNRYINDVRSINPVCTNIFLDTPSSTGATGPHFHLGVP